MFNLIELKINDIVKYPSEEGSGNSEAQASLECVAEPFHKKKRGRPSLGKPTPVVMDAHEEEIARQMGDGVKSFGVRMALRAVQVIGVDKARELAQGYKATPGDTHE